MAATAGVDYDLVLDGVGYMVDNYTENSAALLVAKVANVGTETHYDDLTGPQFHTWNKWSGGMGQRRLEQTDRYLYALNMDCLRGTRMTLAPRIEWVFSPTSGDGLDIRCFAEFNGYLWMGAKHTPCRVLYSGNRFDPFNRADTAASAGLGSPVQPIAFGAESWSSTYGTWQVSGSLAKCATAASALSGGLATLAPTGSNWMIDCTMTYPSAASLGAVGVKMNMTAAAPTTTGYALMLGSYGGEASGGIFSYASGGSSLYASVLAGSQFKPGSAYRFVLVHHVIAPQFIAAYWDRAANGSIVPLTGLSPVSGSGVGHDSASYIAGMQYHGNASPSLGAWDDFSLRAGPYSAITSGGLGDNTMDMTVFGNVLYVGNGNTNNIRSVTTADAVDSDCGVRGWYMTQWDDKLISLWNDGTSQWISSSSTIPTTAAGDWTHVACINDPGTPTACCVYVDKGGDLAVYAGLTTGLWVLDYTAGKTYNVLDFHGTANAYNCHGMREWQGALYVPWRGRLLRYNGTSVVDVGPPDEELPAEWQGYISGITASAKNLYVAFTSTDPERRASYILAYDGNSWHPIYVTQPDYGWPTALSPEALYNTIPAIYFDSYERLIWAEYHTCDATSYDIRTDNAYPAVNCIWTNDSPRHDYPRYRYQPQGSWISSWFTAGKDTVDKNFLEVSMLSEDLTATEVIECWYQLDDNADDTDADASWTNLGTFNTSPNQSIDFTNITGKSIRFRLKFKRGTDATKSPKMIALTVKYRVTPDRRIGARFVIRANKAQPRFDGKPDNRDPDTLYNTFLATVAKKIPLTFQSPDGTSHTVEIRGYAKREGKRVKGAVKTLYIEVVVDEVA